MEWRIIKTNSGYHAEYGGCVNAGQEAGFCIGYFMPGFVVQESMRFDTEQEAKRYIKRKTMLDK